MRPFTIIVDSSSDLPPEYIKEHGIRVIPMPFLLDGREYTGNGWEEISGADFYNALRGGQVATTSQINPDTLVEIFSEYAERGEGAIFIPLSSGISGTYQSGDIALSEIKERYPDNDIHVLDSANATIGHGLVAMLAARKRAEGLSASEAKAWLKIKRHSVFALFTVDDLMFLHRGGRVSKLSAVAGSLLGVKPMLNIAPDGTLKLKDKVRGRKAAIEGLAAQMKRCINPDTKLETVTISHGDCEEEAMKLAEIIKGTFDVKEVVVSMLSPVIGAHSGPGTIALFFESDMTRNEYESKFYGGK